MALSYLNERTQNIVLTLLKQSDVVTIKDLAEEFSVSTRTIYKEIDKANEWLRLKDLPEIEIIRGKIQPFFDEDKPLFEKAFVSEEEVETYVFTPTERTRIIICQIILSETLVSVEDLMESCQVSRNTIFTDLQVVVSQLNTYQITLSYEKKKGYFIEGNAIRIRAIFFLYFNMLEPLLSAGKLNFIHQDELKCHLHQLQQIEKELNVHYVYNDMLALAAMLPIMKKGQDTLNFSNMSIQKIQESKEYGLVSQTFPSLIEMEKVYLTLHFLGGRLTSYSSEEKDEYLLEIAKNLVAEFENIGCVSFNQKDELIQNLYHHIEASIYRYQFGIQIGNPIAEDIKREYPYIFDTMKEAARYLEQQIGVQISDSEIAYLSLHFGSALENTQRHEKQLRILIVCMNGVATGNMISHELQRILPQAHIVSILSASEYRKRPVICDIIISSVNLTAVVPVIVVNPVLNDFDRKNILNHPLIRSRFGFVDMDALYQMVKKYVPQDKHQRLKNDLRRFFTQNQSSKQPSLKPNVWRLTDFLTDDRILFLDPQGNNKQHPSSKHKDLPAWQRSLYTVGQPLLKRGSINEEYILSTIERLEEAGPYMFVTKDLILAHARPDKGVKHIDIAMGLCPEGIEFMDGKKARVVFILVVEDQHKHMGILQDIRKSLAQKKFVDDLMLCVRSRTVCKIILNKLGLD